MVIIEASGISLPAELEREIFEIAASANPSCVVELVRVARRVQEWVGPELYRVLRCGQKRVVPPIYSSVSDSGSPRLLDIPYLKSFGHHVQHILLQQCLASDVQEILKYCPNVHNLVLWGVHDSCLPLLPVLDALSIRRLSFDTQLFFPSYYDPIPFVRPLFTNVTHLEMINAPFAWERWHNLALMPRLSHLALSADLSDELLKIILEDCKMLELLIVFFGHPTFLDEAMATMPEDHRIVMVSSVRNRLDHWELGARGGDDFWIIAAKLAAKAIRRTVWREFISTPAYPCTQSRCFSA
ncbi:hypothetical protein B0H34DRAFT_515389 [Crassisporium funariophilum]|nr:hypothetical protein B0H34DRAFT_515389 [Crassisporium funariophilum]